MFRYGKLCSTAFVRVVHIGHVLHTWNLSVTLQQHTAIHCTHEFWRRVHTAKTLVHGLHNCQSHHKSVHISRSFLQDCTACAPALWTQWTRVFAMYRTAWHSTQREIVFIRSLHTCYAQRDNIAGMCTNIVCTEPRILCNRQNWPSTTTVEWRHRGRQRELYAGTDPFHSGLQMQILGWFQQSWMQEPSAKTCGI